MPLTCNIDAKGKRARFLMGIGLIVAAGAVAAITLWRDGGWMPWTLAGILLTSGVFGLFEARSGWCLLRSMGIRTPI